MVRILHLEDNSDDAFLIATLLRKAGIKNEIVVAPDQRAFSAALDLADIGLVLSDNCILGFDAIAALKEARTLRPGIPFICISGSNDPERIHRIRAAGVDAVVSKENSDEIIAAVKRACGNR